MAHHGVLFLDELLEFPRTLLDALRQPLEDGQVVIARARRAVTFPARFTLVGATNPCPCGFAGDFRRTCTCAPRALLRYQARLSGPLADRIDVHVTVGSVPIHNLSDARTEDCSQEMRMRVHAARLIQALRYRNGGAGSMVVCNAHAPGRWLATHTAVTPAARTLLASAAERLSLTARGYHRVLKVARTIADLDADDAITPAAVGEALRYRPTEPENATAGYGRIG
jgi:magnesium chelatase family protein